MNSERYISLLFPDGRAFANVEYSEKFNRVLATQVDRAFSWIQDFQDQIWYTNENFNPEPWEERYDIPVPIDSTLEQRRQVVKSYMLWPETPSRLSLEYLQKQLDNAGFEEVTISRNPNGDAYNVLHGNNVTDTENFTIGSEPYNSILISGNLTSDYYKEMLLLLMSIKPLDTVVYDLVTSHVALAVNDGVDDFALAIGETLDVEFGSFGTGNSEFNQPTGIAINDTNIFVCDRLNNRIQVLDLDGNYVSEFFDNVTLSVNDGVDDIALAVNDGVDDFALVVSQTMDAYALAVNNSNVFVTDKTNNKVFIFNLSGVYVSEFGSFGTGNSEFNQPTGITVDSNNIYVCDSGNNRVQVFDLSGVYVSEFGGFGTGNGEFDNPTDVKINSSNIYVCDSGNNRVQVFNLSGVYVSEFGSFNNPLSLAINTNFVYVSDKGNGKVQKFDLLGTFDFEFTTTETTDTTFNNTGYIVDNEENIFITDFNNKIKKYNKNLSLIVNQI